MLALATLASVLLSVDSSGGPQGLEGVDMADILGGLMGGLGRAGGAGPGKAGKGREACQFPAPKLGSHLKSEANGCGPKGLKVDEPYGLVKCCNRHDICYWLCNTEFSFCEKQFTKCMKKVCNDHGAQAAECKQQANSFSGMTASFGSGMHASGQRDQCDCFGTAEEAAARHKVFLTQFYEAFNATAATEENVDAVLDRYRGKEGELYYHAALKYGLQFVKFDGVYEEL